MALSLAHTESEGGLILKSILFKGFAKNLAIIILGPLAIQCWVEVGHANLDRCREALTKQSSSDLAGDQTWHEKLADPLLGFDRTLADLLQNPKGRQNDYARLRQLFDKTHISSADLDPVVQQYYRAQMLRVGALVASEDPEIAKPNPKKATQKLRGAPSKSPSNPDTAPSARSISGVESDAGDAIARHPGRHLPEAERFLVDYLERNKIESFEAFVTSLVRHRGQLLNIEATARAEEREARRLEAQARRANNPVVIDGNRLVANRIEPGIFAMGEAFRKVEVMITRPFEMMATLTTQIVWRKVAELANTRLADKYTISTEPSRFKGNTLPVEGLRYAEVQNWIDALNELSRAGEEALFDLIPDHQAGDVYRLPTEAEWEFVARGRGQYDSAYHFGSQVHQLGEYAWFVENANSKTHPVAQKKPLIVDGQEFYDMHGNVAEWVRDWYGDHLSGGIDPEGPANGSFRVIRGGGWLNVSTALRSAWRNSDAAGARVGHQNSHFFNNVGFRLVRQLD